MPFPALSTARVNPLVTNILLAYTNKDFIAGQILPSMPQTEEAGKIGEIGNSHLRIYDSRRAIDDEGEHRMEFTYSQNKSYQVEFYDLEIYLSDRKQNAAQKPFNLKSNASQVLLQAMMLEREAALAAAFTNTGVLTQNTTLSGTDQWSDYVNSKPEDDIETGRTAIYLATGREANSVMIGRKVFNTMKRHPYFLNQVRGIKVLSSSALMEMIKDLFEVENVYIGKNIKITTNEGQSETKGVVWGNDVVLFYKASNPMFEPTLGAQFTLTGANMRADERRAPNDLGDISRVMWAYQDKILDTNCAYLIKSVVA
jgi:hypothetical protein